MSSLRKLIFAAVLAAFALGLLPAAAPAGAPGELAQTRDKIAAARHHKTTLNEQISALDGKLAALDAQLKGLRDKIGGVEQRLAATRDKLRVLDEQLRLKRAELAKARRQLALEQSNFQQRVVIVYKTSDLSYLDVLMASNSFEDLVSRVDVVRSPVGGDDRLVGQLQATRTAVREQKQAIATRENEVHKAVDDLQAQSAQLAALRAAQAGQQSAALAARREKTGALAHVNSDLALLERQENQLLAESSALSGVINGSSGGGGGTGRLAWPVGGPVTSPFGWRMHPILHVRRFHTGIDIGVGYGTAIHAADSGTVIYATWMSGYGNVTIIDHGRGVSTLYAHQSSLAVGVGARVTRGQVIGYVGSTGFSTGPHLHFEVRLNGTPVDPLAYLH
jgi:murein DD-endopeptidase MepM/ murein hydrolase activator NlpD